MTGDIVKSEKDIAVLGETSWDDLLENATAVISAAQLEKDKSRLLGIPHIITRVTYRPGIEDKDYVSVEAVVAPEHVLKAEISRGRVPLDVNTPVTDVSQLSVYPGEKIVYNDGSTGIRRQLTGMFYNLGMLHIPGIEAVQNGDYSIFDSPYSEWDMVAQTGLMNGDNEDEKIEVPDFSVAPSGKPLAIVVDHGLRVSIEPKFNKEVFYLT